MPISKKGKRIMNAFRKEYGKKKGKRIFYAFANKHPRLKLHRK